MSAPVSPHRMVVKNCYAGLENKITGELEQVRADFRYDTRDPWAITVVFHGRSRSTVEWLFARDLLNAGVLCLAGADEGDVVVCPDPGDAYTTLVDVTGRVEGSSEMSHAVFHFNIEDVTGFLLDAYGVVPPGREGDFFDFDREFAKLARMWG